MKNARCPAKVGEVVALLAQCYTAIAAMDTEDQLILGEEEVPADSADAGMCLQPADLGNGEKEKGGEQEEQLLEERDVSCTPGGMLEEEHEFEMQEEDSPGEEGDALSWPEQLSVEQGDIFLRNMYGDEVEDGLDV